MAAEQDNGSAEDPFQEILDRFIEVEEGQKCCTEIVENLIDNCVEKLLEHQTLERKMVPFCVEATLADVVSTMQWMFLGRDEGEVDLASDPMWQVDEEPRPAITDSWARGTVPVRVRAPALYASGTSTMRSQDSEAKSTRSSRATTRRGGKKKNIVTTADKKPTSAGDDGMGRSGFGGGGKEKKQKESLDLKDPRVQAELLKQKLLQYDKEEEAKYEKVKQEMKGKDYFYDSKGDPVLMQPVDGDKLPSTETNVRVNIHDMMDKEETKKDKKGSRSPEKKTEKKKKDDDGLVHFKELASVQPPMAENIKLQPGVTLKEGPVTKAGPPRPEDPDKKRYTRKEFTDMCDSAGAFTMTMTMSNIGGGVPIDDNPFGVQNQNSLRERSTVRDEKSNYTAASTNIDSDGLGADFDRLNDENDPNVALINAPDWGTNTGGTYNPPPQPPPVSNMEKEQALGTPAKYPRDRPFVQKDNSRLPAPLYPALHGHGKVVEGELFPHDGDQLVLPPIAQSALNKSMSSTVGKDDYIRDFPAPHPPAVVKKNPKAADYLGMSPQASAGMPVQNP